MEKKSNYFRGQVFIGSYKNDLKNGQGNLTLASGENYVGSFFNGKRNGYGNLTFANGDNYVGTFNKGEIDGQGVYSWQREPYRYS